MDRLIDKLRLSAPQFCLSVLLALAILAGPQVLPGLGSGIANAQTVRSIQVVGNRRVEPETVQSYLTFGPGDPYDPASVNASLRALFETGLFADVSIDRQGGVVIVTVQENPVVAQVAFEGNSEVDDTTLAGEVRLKPRSVYTRARALADAQRILDVYRRQGRFAASVEPQLIQLGQNRVNVVFEIVEGEKTSVRAVSFIGNRAFSDSQLRDIITTTQSGWFDFLQGTNVYDPDRLNLDKELLRQYYLRNGYADAVVTSSQAELDREGQGFYITFVIDEGPRYTFGDVRIENSLPDLRPEALQGDILTLSGATFDASRIEKTTERLTLKVAEQGFAFARVRVRSERDPGAQQIHLVYAVDEGSRVYIERIEINGNERTKDHVIRREFRLAEGDAFNPLLVNRAEKRLKALGFFKSVRVSRRPGSARDRVVVDVTVEEQPTGELSFGAGFSTSEGIIGDIGVTERNLFGNGQFLKLKLAGSFERFQIDLSFTEPRFLDRNLSAGFDIFHKEVDQTTESGFRSQKTGGALRLGFPLNENLWVNTRYSLSRDSITAQGGSPSLIVQNAEEDSPYITSLFGTTIQYDARNHRRNPNRGIFATASVDVAGLGGDTRYVRIGGEVRGYYPLAEGVTLIGRAIGGHISAFGGDEIRLLDLYYKGGETVRGFERSGLGPRITTGDGSGDAVGATTFWATTAEVRFPLPLVPSELGMTGAVFADAGSAFGTSDAVDGFIGTNGITVADSNTIRSSVGLSLLWNSPVGPVRFDYAFPLTKADEDDTQPFRFGASTNF